MLVHHFSLNGEKKTDFCKNLILSIINRVLTTTSDIESWRHLTANAEIDKRKRFTLPGTHSVWKRVGLTLCRNAWDSLCVETRGTHSV